MSEGEAPFRFLFRVRYGECDQQNIVFNARWGDYIDMACTEYLRAMFAVADSGDVGLHIRLVRQLIEWKEPGRFDDVIAAEVRTPGDCARLVDHAGALAARQEAG